MKRPQKTQNRDRRLKNELTEGGIFITYLCVGLWQKLGKQSATRERGGRREYQFPATAATRERGRGELDFPAATTELVCGRHRCPAWHQLSAARSLVADDQIVCLSCSRGYRLRIEGQTDAGRRYGGFPTVSAGMSGLNHEPAHIHH